MSDLESASDVLGSEYLVGDAAARDMIHTLPAWKQLSPQEQAACDKWLLSAQTNPDAQKGFAEVKKKPVAEQLAMLKQLAQLDQQFKQALEQGVSTQVDLAKVDFNKPAEKPATSSTAAKKYADWAKAPAWSNGPARWKVGAGAGAGAVALAALLGIFLRRR